MFARSRLCVLKCVLIGIRAVLVDKDNKPQWNPATLGEVSSESINKYFESLNEHELVLPPL